MHRGFGGGFRRGGFGYRRGGFPIYGMGFGMGGPSLLTSLMAGGLGYLLGSSTANQQMPPMQQAPMPQYQQPQAAPQPNSTPDNGMLSQLKMLSDLHNSGALTDDEFVKAKNRLFGS